MKKPAQPPTKKTTKKSAARPAKRTAQANAVRKQTAHKRTSELAPLVLKGMEAGKSLRQACEAVKVPLPTFLRWVDENPNLAEQYTRARARLLDIKAEELEEIGEQAAKAKDSVTVAGLRLQSDNRKWLLGKLAPKKYGDRVTHQGDEEAPPIQLETTELTTAQRASRLASLMALQNRKGARA